MGEWVKCSEQMPAPNVKVLTYSKSIGVFFALRKNRQLNPWEYLDGETCYSKVTHWQPLPEPPK